MSIGYFGKLFLAIHCLFLSTAIFAGVDPNEMDESGGDYVGLVEDLIKQARELKAGVDAPVAASNTSAIIEIDDTESSSDGEEAYYVGFFSDMESKVARVYFMGVVSDYSSGDYLPDGSMVESIAASSLSVSKVRLKADGDAVTEKSRMFITSIRKVEALKASNIDPSLSTSMPYSLPFQ